MLRSRPLASLLALTLLGLGAPAFAQQPRPLTPAECQTLRQRLAGHARLSEGVRRSVAAVAGPAPATQPAPPATVSAPPAPTGRADTIRARLAQIPAERQTLEDQRLAAMVRFDLTRATQIQGQIQTLDAERASLERELASLPATPAPATPPVATPPAPSTASAPPSDAERVRCQDVAGTLDAAVKTRQRELGAREGQAGAIPLVALQGQSPDQIASELAAQFAAWPEAATQVGLLDQDGNGRLDAFVDAPGPDTFRLYRQRSDGSLGVETFTVAGRSATPSVSEVTRRIEETALRGSGTTLEDLLAARAAGPARVVGESGDYAAANAALLAGAYADAAKVDGAAARTREFPNYRGETVRVVEVIAPTTGGVAHRRVVVTPRPNGQEQWEETTTVIRPVTFWRTDVEMTGARDTRAAGAAAGPRTPMNPLRFSVER